jgi:putative membrane protein
VDLNDPNFDARSITRPDPALLTYYIISAVLSGPFIVVVLIPLLFRYHTLKYRFDDEGISMSWGVIFHQEVYLQYRRIQDIHVTRNVLHRWLGLSAVAVQTAAGSAAAEMRIEGIKNPEALRDFLYTRMRGARGLDAPPCSSPAPAATPPVGAPPDDEALALLREIRDLLRAQHAGDKS